MWFRRRPTNLHRYITDREPLDWYLELLLERLDRIAEALEALESDSGES